MKHFVIFTKKITHFHQTFIKHVDIFFKKFNSFIPGLFSLKDLFTN